MAKVKYQDGPTAELDYVAPVLRIGVVQTYLLFFSGFTLLAFELPSSAPQDLQPNPVQTIMQLFGWDDMVHPLLVTRYLPHLLQNRLDSTFYIRPRHKNIRLQGTNMKVP